MRYAWYRYHHQKVTRNEGQFEQIHETLSKRQWLFHLRSHWFSRRSQGFPSRQFLTNPSLSLDVLGMSKQFNPISQLSARYFLRWKKENNRFPPTMLAVPIITALFGYENRRTVMTRVSPREKCISTMARIRYEGRYVIQRRSRQNGERIVITRESPLSIIASSWKCAQRNEEPA